MCLRIVGFLPSKKEAWDVTYIPTLLFPLSFGMDSSYSGGMPPRSESERERERARERERDAYIYIYIYIYI